MYRPRDASEPCHIHPHSRLPGRALPAVLLLGLSWSAAADTGVPEPLIQVAPTYPEEARRLGVEGHVELELLVSPNGTVSEATVTAAEPPGLFDHAAVAAAERWRYTAAPGRGPQTARARLDFRIDETASPAATREPAERAVAVGRRNECVRQDAVYHYGDVVEIDLVNTCEEPLVVYGCARGTGGYTGRWVCFDSEQQRSLLVPADDPRLGDSARVETLEGVFVFTYADSFHLRRAPNSQYWWAACHAADAACRGTARQWAQSVNLQTDRIHPQHRTHLTLARSN